MNKKLTKITQIILPSLTLLIGLFAGSHYQEFREEIIGFIYEKDIVLQSELNTEEKIDEEYDIKIKDKLKDENIYILPDKSEFDMNMFWNAWDTLRDKFFIEDIVDVEDVLYGAIAGMVDSLDDYYTVFYNPEEAEDFRIDVDGELEGIGAEIIYRKKTMIISSVLKGSPAKIAGIKADDIILKIDEISVNDMDFFEAISKIRGKKGTEVKINIYRIETDETIDFNIKRDEISVENVIWGKIDDKYAHLIINRFTSDVDQELKKVSNEILAFDPDGIILDLRDDGGGYMDQAVHVSDAFISDGPIVSRKYRDGQIDYFKASSNTIFAGYPLVVLINHESASASEIVAGAIQDYAIGTIMGETSYGKGTVQQAFNIGKATLKVTVAKWYTPKNRNINGIGIEPDIVIEKTIEDFENDIDPQLDGAIEHLEKLN